MQRKSFTNALRATAKIACAASLLNVSCKSKTPAEVAAPNNSTVDTTDEEPLLPEESIEQMNIPNEHPDNNDPTETQYAECQPVISEAFSDDSFPMPSEVSQEVKDCCALTAAYYDALRVKTNDFNIVMDWKEKDQCCSALEWSDGSMACTPWGPPTPPSARKMKRSIVIARHQLVS